MIFPTVLLPHKSQGIPCAVTGGSCGLGGEVWSRRITEKDRLVYDIQSDVVTIIACRFHYDDH